MIIIELLYRGLITIIWALFLISYLHFFGDIVSQEVNMAYLIKSSGSLFPLAFYLFPDQLIDLTFLPEISIQSNNIPNYYSRFSEYPLHLARINIWFFILQAPIVFWLSFIMLIGIWLPLWNIFTFWTCLGLFFGLNGLLYLVANKWSTITLNEDWFENYSRLYNGVFAWEFLNPIYSRTDVIEETSYMFFKKTLLHPNEVNSFLFDYLYFYSAILYLIYIIYNLVFKKDRIDFFDFYTRFGKSKLIYQFLGYILFLYTSSLYIWYIPKEIYIYFHIKEILPIWYNYDVNEYERLLWFIYGFLIFCFNDARYYLLNDTKYLTLIEKKKQLKYYNIHLKKK